MTLEEALQVNVGQPLWLISGNRAIRVTECRSGGPVCVHSVPFSRPFHHMAIDHPDGQRGNVHITKLFTSEKEAIANATLTVLERI